MNTHFTRPDAYLERRNAVHRPANDGEPVRVALPERFADLIGRAMAAIYLSSGAALIACLLVGAQRPAWLFLGAMLTSASTAILADLFKSRIAD